MVCLLYIDSKKRIENLKTISNTFQEKGCPNTSAEVLKLIPILEGDKVPGDFLKNWNSLFDILGKDFEDSVNVGQAYRKKCYEYIRNTTFEAHKRMGKDFPAALLTIHPLFQKVNVQNSITGSIADLLGSKSATEPIVKFHLHCYAYLVFMEGIFDELSRILYFLAVVNPTNIPPLATLDNTSPQNIIDALGTAPVFLEKWSEKNHIRNSIAHARAIYDPKADIAQFTDIYRGTITYDSGPIKLSDFVQKALEIEDTLRAFYSIFLLLSVHDLILVKDYY